MSRRPRRPVVDQPAAPSTRRFALVLTAMLLLALNLRIPTSALGPLLPDVRAETGRGETFLSLLTSIPLALTLLVAPFAPRLAARLGRQRVLLGVVAVISAGTVLRSVPGDPALLAGTVLLGCAIAVGTVLAPAAIAAEPPERRGSLTGAFTMALSLGPALALGLTVPIMQVTGLTWRGTLALWASVGAIALLAWIPYARASRPSDETEAPQSIPEPSMTGTDAEPRTAVADPQAWLLALYLGITSLTFYTVSAWLPTSFVMDGLSAGAAGGYTSLINLVALPFAFLAPVGMRRGWGRLLAPLSPLAAAVGIALLLAAGGAAALPIALLLGVAQGLCLGVSYAQVVQYARSPGHAASVSALTSTVGIAIASLGPLGFGLGLELSGSDVVPVTVLGAVILAQAAIGLHSGRTGSVRRAATAP